MEEEIVKKLKELLTFDPSIVLGTVKSVNPEKNTITAEVDGLIYEDIRLNATAISSSQKVLFIPEKGTRVILSRIEHSEEDFKVLGVDKIERVLIQVKTTKIDIDKDGVKIERNGQDHKTITESFMDLVMNLVIPTSTGPATLDPATRLQIQELKAKFGQVFK